MAGLGDQFVQNLIQSMVSSSQQPTAELNQTQTSTGATAAQIPGIQAESGIKQVQQQQANNPLLLKDDLQTNKMTLPDALKKYSSLMNADDIFKQYLAQSPWGLPQESPTQLQNMGISPQTLGQIGQNGSFADRWNTKQAVLGMRDLQDKWNGVNGLSKLGILGFSLPTPTGQGYSTQRQFLGEHLSSLIPGAPGGENATNSLMSKIPDVGHIAENEPGAAQNMFGSAEKGLLNVKGYDYKDLGLQEPASQAQTSQAPDSGKSNTPSPAPSITGNKTLDAMLTTGVPAAQLLNPAMQSDIKDNVSGMANTKMFGVNSLNPADIKGQTDFFTGIPKEYASLLSNPMQHLEQHPFNTAADVLGVLGLRGDGAPVEGETSPGVKPPEPADPFANAPGKIAQTITPNRAMSAIGDIRDNLLKTADKAGKSISGEDLASGIRKWADMAKNSNLPDAQAIEDAAVQAEKQYTGKTFKPSEVRDIYDNIEKGYTTTGQPRSATASYIDRGVKGVLADNLERVAPGFAKTSDLFSKTYQAQKGIPAKMARGLPQGVLRTGMNLAGLGFLREILSL